MYIISVKKAYNPIKFIKEYIISVKILKLFIWLR